MNSKIKKTGFLFLIMAGLFLANISFTEAAVEWETITDLPGLPAGSKVTLSDFIIVIYDFLLSAVGIAAMFMIVIGGFRYLTAAGNAAALSEAKDIIYSALYGLLLALCVWIIVSTINPDLVYLKQPGANPEHGDYGCLYGGSACVAGDNCCYGNCGDVNANQCPKRPDSCIDPTSSEEGAEGNCSCINGNNSVAKVAGKNCTETCRPSNCLVADVKIGINQNNFGMGISEIIRRYCKYDSTEENPIEVADDIDNTRQFIVCGRNTISGNPIKFWHWDIDGDNGNFSFPNRPPVPDPYVMALASYSYYLGRTGCAISTTPDAITCPLVLKAEDDVGNESEDRVFLRILKPKNGDGSEITCWPNGAYCYLDSTCCSGDCSNSGAAPTWTCI